MPDRPTSIKRIYTDYDFDLAISNQANPSEPVPTTTQYYTTDGIKKGVPFRNASGFSKPEMDALVEKIKVETDPAKRKALVIDFQKLATQEARNLPLVELEFDHHGQHAGAEPLQRPELPRRELVRHMAGGLSIDPSARMRLAEGPLGGQSARSYERDARTSSPPGVSETSPRLNGKARNRHGLTMRGSSRQLAALRSCCGDGCCRPCR